MGGYRIIATFTSRPWWALGLLEREREIVMASAPDADRASLEALRQIALDVEGCTGARLEVVE